MQGISEGEAIAGARAHLGLDSSVRAEAWRTRRIDRPGEEYYLVIFGEHEAAVGVAAVDVARGEVMVSAALSGHRSHLSIDAQTALRRAGSPVDARIRLVWQSCTGSRSPLYPLWEIRADERTVYVDQQGVVWESLERSEGRGG